jgi:hypothetical protein
MIMLHANAASSDNGERRLCRASGDKLLEICSWAVGDVKRVVSIDKLATPSDEDCGKLFLAVAVEAEP